MWTGACAHLMVSLVLFVALLLPRSATAGGLDIERPGQRQFVADHADLLDDAAERRIRTIAADLLDDHATALVVVTIDSMAEHGGERMDIETFARILFDQWGVGHPSVEGQQWDTGILVVISKRDRKARIELGTGWAHDKDAEAQRIMSQLMVPAFREGDYSRGAVEGVIALDAMARQKPLPQPADNDWWIEPLMIALAILLAVGILVSLIRSGTSGWGWKLLALVVAVIGALLVSWWRRPSSRECSGGRRRGSFGGGRSGGGGASGSW
jgi:uncharacterized protein